MASFNLFGEPIVPKVEVEEKVSKPGTPALFDWIKALTYSKIDYRKVGMTKTKGRAPNKVTVEIPPDVTLRGFDPYIIAKGLGQSEETIGFANMMNRTACLPKEAQYLFYMSAIPKHNSFAKWAKEEKDERLPYIQKKFGYSADKAKEVLRVLTEEQINSIIASMNKGGHNSGEI